MPSSHIDITPGNGQLKVATWQYTDPDDSLTKELQMLILTNKEGEPSGIVENPFWVTLASGIKGENGPLLRMMGGDFGKKIRITGNNTVKPAMGFLHGFSVNEVTGSGILTVFDNTSATGDVVWQGTLTSADNHKFIQIDQVCETGIVFSYGSGLAVGLGVSWV